MSTTFFTAPSSADLPLASPRVVFLGTEGTGKTVLITTLAKRFMPGADPSLYLDPRTPQTIRYVENNWQILQQGSWPPSSPMGQLAELHWELCQADHTTPLCEIRIVDCAGQDLRVIFGQDHPAKELPEALARVANYCRSADIIVCLVNLKDFMAEADAARRVDNEIVIKSALQELSDDPTGCKRFCLLYTQVDQYPRLHQQYDRSWRNVARKFMPYVYTESQRHSERIEFRAAAAVAQVKVDEGPNGLVHRIPVKDFKSIGISELMNWLVMQVQSLPRVPQNTQVDDPLKTEIHPNSVQNSESQPSWRSLLNGVVPVAMIFLAIFFGVGPFSRAKQPPTISRPLAWGTEWGIKYGSFLVTQDDIWLQNNTFQPWHNIELKVDVYEYEHFLGTTTLWCPNLLPGERKVWVNQIEIVSESGNRSTAEVKYDLGIPRRSERKAERHP